MSCASPNPQLPRNATARSLQLPRILLPLLAGLPALVLGFSSGPPTRRTGAPVNGGLTCTVCHATFAPANSDTRGSLTIDVQPYSPGAVQVVRVTVRHPEASQWGFQLTARMMNDLTKPAGTFTVSDLVRVRCDDGRDAPCNGTTEFAAHRTPGKASGSFAFDVRWTGPSAGGDVLFYAAGNAANGDGTLFSDRIYTTSKLVSSLSASTCGLTALAVTACDFNCTKTDGGYVPLSEFSAKLGVTATAFCAPDFKTTLQQGWLGQFPDLGLGVCNPEAEAAKACGTSEFRSDMKAEIAEYQFILFRFSTPVDLLSISFAKYDNDRNVVDQNLTYFVGDGREEFSLGSVAELEKTFSAPTSIECSEKCGERSEIAGKGVSFLVVGSSTSEKGVSPGEFRIQGLTVASQDSAEGITATPEPSTSWTGLTALVALAAWFRRRQGTGTDPAPAA